MALSTWTELKASVLNDLLRSGDSDANTRFDDWLLKAEAWIRRKLVGSKLGELVAANASVSSEYTALPADVISIRSASIITSGYKRPLTQTTDERLTDDWSGVAGVPRHFSIVGSSIRLGPPPSGTYTVHLTYTQLAALTSSAPSNWFLVSAPDIYEAAVLAEGHEYYRAIEDADRRRAMALGAIQDLIRVAKTGLATASLQPRLVSGSV